jgi:hypothetical protein
MTGLGRRKAKMYFNIEVGVGPKVWHKSRMSKAND